MTKNLRRGVVALATVLGCLALLGSPASAAVIAADITAGTVTLINSTGTATDTVPLGPGVTTLGTNCVNSIEVVTTETTTSVSHWDITSFTIVSRFILNNVHYIVESTRTGSGSGTVSNVTTTSATLNQATLTLAVNIYPATNGSSTETDCIHGTTRTCRFANVSLSLQGIYSGNLHFPVTSDTASLAGSGTLGATSPPCVAPFTTYNNGTVTVTGLVAHAL